MIDTESCATLKKITKEVVIMENQPATVDYSDLFDLAEWGADDFRTMFEAINDGSGEDAAWNLLYLVWQIRAGEIIGSREAISV